MSNKAGCQSDRVGSGLFIFCRRGKTVLQEPANALRERKTTACMEAAPVALLSWSEWNSGVLCRLPQA
jgi:hypothetical protein